MNRSILVIILILLALPLMAQNRDTLKWDQERDFVLNLEKRKQFVELIYHRNSFVIPDAPDSLDLIYGKAFYKLDDSKQTLNILKDVPIVSPNYKKASQMRIMSYTFLEEYDNAFEICNSQPIDDTIYNETIEFQKLSLLLLSRKINAFDSARSSFDPQVPGIKNLMHDLDHSADEIKAYRKKSPFVAGTLSAIIPGLGKAYAGKPWHGVASFVSVAGLGLQTYESYKRSGINSPAFIIFASLTTAFYIAEIWGTVVSVKVAHKEFHHEKDLGIMLYMRIPANKIIR